jgi:hemoglobin-like flavoprotein
VAQVEPIHSEIANTFYHKLFELDHRAKLLFNHDMEAQGNKLMMFLAMVANSLDNMETMLPIVQDMGRRHRRYGVNLKQYDYVGAALIATLAQYLGAAIYNRS